MAREPLPPQYDFSEEEKIYERWEKSGYFNPDSLALPRDAKPFTIIMPPPNVTGVLHAGHALFVTLQDIFIRFARMRGKRALWLPGTDHAAIATQAKVEKLLYEKERKTRYDLGREEFLKRVNDYALQSQATILSQFRKLGASCDWSRLAYTLDEPRNIAVRTAFARMYEMGLIYRGSRIVNWDPKMQTTVSDDEIEWKEEKAKFYYLQYGPFVIGTSRPETKFGDKYVVMHPDDARYAQYADGQTIGLEWINGPIKATIIKDPIVDPEFGSGVMTTTPWHDAADFDLAERRGLDREQIIDTDGKLLPVAGEFAGMHIKKARPLIVEKLKAKGLLVKTDEEYLHRLATNSRGGGTIEPQIKDQWFVAVNKEFALPRSEIEGIAAGDRVTLKGLMRHVVERGQIKIVPERFVKVYYHWIDNLRDWCISRQIWFGHRIPAWHHEPKCVPREGRERDAAQCRPIIVAPEKPSCEFCDAEYIQDPDTLDTWFSSGLWTFSTLGWPNETPDLKTYHPTQVLETAYEILFFWVARMILMTTCLTGQIPFETVYLHGLVRDERREKLSKSKGDSADPLDIVAKYGTDALRFALVFNTAPGTDSILSEQKIKGMKRFANKLWNIARFVFANVSGPDFDVDRRPDPKTGADAELLRTLGETRETIAKHIESFAVHEAAHAAYHFVWHYYADVYIEASKGQLKNPEVAENTRKILAYSLCQILLILHPFMPFVTETIYERARPGTLLMAAQW